MHTETTATTLLITCSRHKASDNFPSAAVNVWYSKVIGCSYFSSLSCFNCNKAYKTKKNQTKLAYRETKSI